jgi:signal transduction histidine kinase
VPGANTQRGEPSSGLGLALARKLIEAQHGLIRHEPRPGGGTTFLVVLPAAAPLAR